MGLLVTGLSLIGVSILLMIFKDPNLIVTFSFEASLTTLFAQLGRGIFTKAANIGADLVGKVEQRIPEDDPRNPAVIGDTVGDPLKDVAGPSLNIFMKLTNMTALLIVLLL